MSKHLNLGPNSIEGLYIYGSGELDQLSPLQEDGEEILESPLPRKLPLHFISSIESVRTINCGQLFTLILSTSGNVYTFGCADNASLGHAETTKASLVPLKFAALGIAGGDCHGIAYDRENVAFWGQFRNSSGPMGEPCQEPKFFDQSDINGENFRKVISGSNHVIILTEEKNVYSFGNNEFGQLGINPEKILHHFQINKLIYEKNVEDIYTGDDHSFLVKFENGIRVLKSWGNNVYGQLGIGAYNRDGNGTVKIYIPTKVIFPGYPNLSVKKVEGGAGTSICITEDNRIFIWGYNDFSVLGLQDENKIIPNPKELVFFNPFTNPENEVNDVFACHQYFYAKNDKNNKIYSWGLGDSFVLGNKKEKAEITPYLINNLFFKNLYVENLALGCYHVVVKLIEKKYEEQNREKSNIDNKIDIEKKEEIKPKKRKNDGLKEEKEENYGIKVGIKEEYITLNELDQPKFSKKYKLSKKKEKEIDISEIIDNLNKKVEEEKDKVKKIETDSKEGKTSVKKNKQTPSKVKKKPNSKSKEKNKKIDDDIEMKDETGKNSSRKNSNSKNTISLKKEKEKSEEKNKKNSASKNKKKSSSKKKEENDEDKDEERKTNLRKIDLSNKKEKNTKKKNPEDKDKEKSEEKDKKKDNEKSEEKKKSKEKDKGKEKSEEKDKKKSNEKSKEKNNDKKKDKEKSEEKKKDKEKSEEKKKDKEKEKEKSEEKKEDKGKGKENSINKSKSKNKKGKSSVSKDKEKEEKKENKDNKEEKQKNDKKSKKSKSKIRYPKEDDDEIEIDNKKKKKKNESQSKKSQKKEKEEENFENRRILRSSKNKIKEIEKEIQKEKEKEREKEKSKKSIKSKSKERYPKKKK